MMRSQTLTKLVPRHHRAHRRGTTSSPWLMAIFCLPLVFAACGKTPPPPDVYTSRGVIRQLPSPGAHKPEIFIQHEAIAEFRDQDGKVVGMESMAMPFPIDPATAWDDLQVGDKVAFTFEVQWHQGHPLRLTQWQTLSSNTLLGFEMPRAEPSVPSEEEMIEVGTPEDGTAEDETAEDGTAEDGTAEQPTDAP